ncbi:DUF1489 family protein [Limoniibacter endophyticus]|uniref:Lysophospholipase n=1 Tax=Limoniibacter endophyticus TaxID=1565040 RepID=A0A8J3DFS8_9HYPH|nr:DUF1489 family protein [Limoniibacter endophyticus]GHC62213.1 lysophospholipase [Limoniibacter endophyticus]
MSLNIVKLCVGCDSVEDLEAWIAHRLTEKRLVGEREIHWHVTRMVPTRQDELRDGSLYWVIKGNIQCRQKLIGIEPFTDGEGISRCRILLEPEVVRTQWVPRKAFQGWRYFKPEDVPADLGAGDESIAQMPATLRAELAELGLL